MGDYLAEFETSSNKMSSMGLPVAEDILTAILSVSLVNEETLSGTVAASETLEDSKTS